ncbi:MAG: hypothetical protein ACRCX2_20070 [Paraclostridium sp.]
MKNYKAIKTMEKQLQAEFKKPVVEITQKEIDELAKNMLNKHTYTTLRTKVSIINMLFKSIDSKVSLKLNNEAIQSNEKGVICKKDLMGMIELLDNAQDQFILMALFYGINGKQASDLLNLKISDIDFEKNTITLPEKTIHMNTEFARIAKDAIKQEDYIIVSLDMAGGAVVETYKLPKSPYMVKVRPYKKNNMGMDVISYNGFRTRFGTLCKFLDLDVTISSLEKSGIIDKMIEENIGGTVREIEDWLKKNNLKMERFLAFRLYKKQKDML